MKIFKAFAIMMVLTVGFVCTDSSQAGIIKSYDFDGGLSDTLGNGVNLIASGGTISGGRYSFTANQGLRLTSALPSTTNYGIEFRFRVNDSTAGYNKLIDFQDLASDLGLYVLSGQLDFYTVGPAAGSILLNTDYTVGLSRSGGSIQLFLNGVSLFTAADGSSQAVSAANILNFFEDDVGTGQFESFAGSVDFIRIHDDSSTFGQSLAFTSVPEPSTFAIWCLGAIGMAGYGWRRRAA
jgi:PEP-CTERM motif